MAGIIKESLEDMESSRFRRSHKVDLVSRLLIQQFVKGMIAKKRRQDY